MLEKLEEVASRYEDLNGQLADPEVIAKRDTFLKLSKERAQLAEVVETYHRYQKLRADLDESSELLKDSDADIRAMATEDVERLKSELKTTEAQLEILLLPKDPNDEKDVILEIRSGTGGDEAALFAGDLFRMYLHFAETKRWKVEVMNESAGSQGGYKEVIASIGGNSVFSQLKYESGVHRVQRVPDTETQGRIHTSACTVAVLPEAEEVEVQIADAELRVDVFRASGPGGQSVNTTDSAVRLTHKPSGLVVICQDEKSQHKNKAKALRVLRSRLYDKMLDEQQSAIAEERRAMVGSGDRSEKIRTYNFPQDRMTDHRIGVTLHNLPKVMAGGIEEMITALRTHFQAEALKGERPS